MKDSPGIEGMVHRMVGAKLNERRRIGREIIAAATIEGQDVAYWHSRAQERIEEIARLEKIVNQLSVQVGADG